MHLNYSFPSKSVLYSSNAVDLINNLAILCFFLRAITGSIIFLMIGLLLGGFVFGCQVLSRKRAPFLFFVAIIVVFSSYVFTYMNNSIDHGILFIPLFLSCSGIAWRIKSNGTNYKFCLFIFYGSLVYIVIGYSIFNISLDGMFAYSRNHISVYFINAAALLYISKYYSGREFDLKPVIITFIVSLLSVGLSGIVSSGIFLTMVLCYKTFNTIRFYKTMVIVIFGSVSYVIISNWAYIAFFLISAFGLEGDIAIKLQVDEIFNNNPRYKIWSDYFSKLDMTRVLFGINLSETFYGFNNLHNSFLLMHARMGLFSFLLMLVFVYGTFLLFVKNFVLGVCSFVILLRGITDTTFLAGSSFDFILLYLTLFTASHIAEKMITFQRALVFK